MPAKRRRPALTHFAAAPAAEPNLGACLRAFRQRKRLSLSEVAAASGIAASTLSRVENDQLSLTYDKLLKLCRGLQVDLAELLAQPDSREAAPRPAGRRTVTHPGEGREMQVNRQYYNYLCTELSGKKMTPMIGIITARNLEETEGLTAHDGEEFTFVLEGKMLLYTEFYEPLLVDVGGCVYFDSTMAHAYVSAGDVPLKFLCVSSTPENVIRHMMTSSAAGQPSK